MPEIPIDEQAILALMKVTTGAYIHDTNVLVSTYRNWCRRGNEAKAAELKTKMWQRAVAIEQGTLRR
jgi:hypothetical protein